jgi:hypothetical protein
MTTEFTAVGMRFVESVPGDNARVLLDLSTVLLLPEPWNKHDTNAVLVCNPLDGRPLAHVSRETLVALPPLPSHGMKLAVFSSSKREKAVIFQCVTPQTLID